MAKLSVRDVDLTNKNVLVRVDFNVTIVDGEIVDATRIEESVQTIKEVSSAGVCFLASHLGRPKGKDMSCSLQLITDEVSRILNRDVRFISEIEPSKFPSNPKRGDIYMFENLRFYQGEEKNDEAFARTLSNRIDIYVNEAFSASHRKHASIYGVAKFVKQVCAGLTLNKEVESLERLVKSPERPFVLILGGGKVSDKIPLIKNLIGKVDSILLGGAVANTFLSALGMKIGNSFVEKDKYGDVKEIVELAGKQRVKVVLPRDFVVAKEIKAGVATSVVESISDGYYAGDIGPQSIQLFQSELKDAKTVFWNGPLGVYEIEEFSYGTHKVASYLANHGSYTVAGGGDVVGALVNGGFKSKFKHVSTGGGACLEFLGGLKLPGLEVIPNK